MAYYKPCPTCGANLDPGETCTECEERAARSKSDTADQPMRTIRIMAMNDANRRLKPAAGWTFN